MSKIYQIESITATMVNVIVFAFFATLFVMVFFFPAEFAELLRIIYNQKPLK